MIFLQYNIKFQSHLLYVLLLDLLFYTSISKELPEIRILFTFYYFKCWKVVVTFPVSNFFFGVF